MAKAFSVEQKSFSVRLHGEHLVFGVVLVAIWMIAGCGPLSPSLSKTSGASSSKGSESTANSNYKVDSELTQSLVHGASGASNDSVDPNTNVRFVSEESFRVMNQFGETSSWSELSSGETSTLVERGKVNVNLKGQEKLVVYLVVRERNGESKKGLKVFTEKMTARLSSKLTPCVVTKLSEAHPLCTDGAILSLLQKDSANAASKAVSVDSLNELSERIVRVYVKAD